MSLDPGIAFSVLVSLDDDYPVPRSNPSQYERYTDLARVSSPGTYDVMQQSGPG
jgi:hypothetical protein